MLIGKLIMIIFIFEPWTITECSWDNLQVWNTTWTWIVFNIKREKSNIRNRRKKRWY